MLTRDDLHLIKLLLDERFKELGDRFDIKLKKALRGVVRRKDLLAMERRLIKKINSVVDHFDPRLLKHDDRLISIEKRFNLPLPAQSDVLP